jgi:hypothetical protein
VKSYKFSLVVSVILLALYILAQIYKPKPLDWTVTLSQKDKNPFGAYIVYHQLQQVFPKATVSISREPFYTKLYEETFENTAYFAISPELSTDTLDVAAACKFVEDGNYLFISANELSKKLRDTLGITVTDIYTFNLKDSSAINFVSPSVKAPKNYTSSKSIVNNYFDSIRRPDSTVILGTNDKGKANFIRVNCGEGAFFVHATPLVFSNYFIAKDGNANYTATALSFIPASVTTVVWDEYYKLGRAGAATPLRFFLENDYLRWALWLAIIAMIMYVLFNIKRKQRIIPIITPLQNATLDFVKTIASVYFQQKDNRAIAYKKLQHWLDFVRQRFHISTLALNDDFVQLLVKKSGVGAGHVESLIYYVSIVEKINISDKLLLEISDRIDNFYKSAKAS